MLGPRGIAIGLHVRTVRPHFLMSVSPFARSAITASSSSPSSLHGSAGCAGDDSRTCAARAPIVLPLSDVSVISDFGTDGCLKERRVCRIWFIVSCVGFAMTQTPSCDGLLFDHFSLFQNCFTASEVEVPCIQCQRQGTSCRLQRSPSTS